MGTCVLESLEAGGEAPPLPPLACGMSLTPFVPFSDPAGALGLFTLLLDPLDSGMAGKPFNFFEAAGIFPEESTCSGNVGVLAFCPRPVTSQCCLRQDHLTTSFEQLSKEEHRSASAHLA